MNKQSVSIILSLVIAGVLMAFTFQKTQKHPVKKPDGKKSNVAAAQVSYNKDVKPILKKYCLPCHTEDEMNPSELYLDTYESMMTGGKHGKPILPAQADSSLIVQKLGPKPPIGDPMPLKRKTPFPGDTLQVIKTWINQGAKNN